MIQLKIRDYCQECSAFDPIAVKAFVTGEDGEDMEITEVRCARWELCANVAKRAKRAAVDNTHTSLVFAPVEVAR